MKLETEAIEQLQNILSRDQLDQVLGIIGQEDLNRSRDAHSDFYRDLIDNKLSEAELDVRKSSGNIGVFIINFNKEIPTEALLTIQELFEEDSVNLVKKDDFNLVLIAESVRIEPESIREIAEEIVSILASDLFLGVRVSFSNIASGYKQVHPAYVRCRQAMDMGLAFYAQDTIYNYYNMGLEKLISSMSDGQCQEYLADYQGGLDMEQLDEETISIIDCLIRNNLNMSETSRELYMHRNTLTYRLDKFAKQTNLDVRQLKDAMTYLIAKFMWMRG